MSEKLKELKYLSLMIGVFVLAFYIPFDSFRFKSGLMEAFYMLQEYAQLHVLFCLIPALFIAGAVSVFISQAAVLKYLGAKAPKWVAYSVASVSGAILAVCSCTILPLFSGIYKRGAGLGPAIAFLYSGPAINILAIVMTARILGIQIGIARAVGAVVFSIVIGLCMHLIFRKEEQKRQDSVMTAGMDDDAKPLWQTIIYFGLMIIILLVLNWAKPNEATGSNFMNFMFANKWVISAGSALILGFVLNRFYGLSFWKVIVSAIVVGGAAFFTQNMSFMGQPVIPYLAAIILLITWLAVDDGELSDWLGSTWTFAKLIIPLLFIGVMIAGSLLGRPGHEAWIPSHWIESAVGGNSLLANFFASISGAFMYFATLTEVPILQGLMGAGMGKGPALALLLSGPALSLPSMLVINSVIGIKKTVTFVALVVVFSTFTGYIFGLIAY